MSNRASWRAFCAVVFLIISLCLPGVAYAATTPTPTTITVQETPPPSSAPSLIITSIAGSSLADYVELYNQSDAPMNLTGWTLNLTTHDTGAPACTDVTVSIQLPSAWILSKKYLTLQRNAVITPGMLTVPFAADSTTLLAGCTVPKLTTLAIIPSSDPAASAEQLVTIPAAEWSATATTAVQHKQRGNSPSSTRAITNVFDTDYKIVTGAIALNSDPLYTPPVDVAGLQMLEILPNARSCSPLETDPTCNDYVKFYNPTDQPINLANYRLRIAAKGQNESVTNTFSWGQDIDPASFELDLLPDTYFMLTMRNDGQPLSITDSGNFVWLEDAYGTTTYAPIVQYPDSSSTTKIGQAWAYDGTTWQWTSTPKPGAANYFPPVITPPTTTSSSSTIVTSILKPCAANQYRNPDTNRCNTIVTATTLAPCDAGEERNPETNRCRSIATTASTLTPCQDGWERNPDTNRCRKIVTAVAGDATTAIKDVAVPSTDSTGWFVAVVVTALALGYAVYEWRQDIILGATNARSIIRSFLTTRFHH